MYTFRALFDMKNLLSCNTYPNFYTENALNIPQNVQLFEQFA